MRGPLAGMPILLKDNIATGDRQPTTAGSLALASAHARDDAFVTKKLRDAGAVMDRWLELCSALKPCEYPDCDPAKLFNGLLAEGGRHG